MSEPQTKLSTAQALARFYEELTDGGIDRATAEDLVRMAAENLLEEGLVVREDEDEAVSAAITVKMTPVMESSDIRAEARRAARQVRQQVVETLQGEQ